ncbi:hypothetical protein BBP40_011798 [Aspergillus hancockii]|nr:hypothetical protein BBP40_011798 [Aspergillus hancockii]
MAICHTKFDMNELARRAAEAVGVSQTKCVRAEKFPDGMFSRAFLSQCKMVYKLWVKPQTRTLDGRTIPLPAKWLRWIFARNKLSMPAPKVLAWSSKAKENSVGDEYIIMEKAAGVQLKVIWSRLDIKEKFEVVKVIS